MKGNRIRQARLAAGLTLVALGENLATRGQTYSAVLSSWYVEGGQNDQASSAS
jgi:transcriptional regulator with XRE-family HTH domain